MTTLPELAAAARAAQDAHTHALNEVRAARETVLAALERYEAACRVRLRDPQAQTAATEAHGELTAALAALEAVETTYGLR